MSYANILNSLVLKFELYCAFATFGYNQLKIEYALLCLGCAIHKYILH